MYRVDAFNGSGKHEVFLLPTVDTEEQANGVAKEIFATHPQYILFLLKETSISGMFDVVRMYNREELS